MADHRIKVSRQVIQTNGQAIEHAVPDIPATGMYVNDTVTYFSPDGDVTITFPSGSPFASNTIPGEQTNTLIKGGVFQCACSLNLKPDGRRIGWKPGDNGQSPSGGLHDVQPH